MGFWQAIPENVPSSCLNSDQNLNTVMTEFEKPPVTLTCFARNHIIHSDPDSTPLLQGSGDLCRILDAVQTSCKIITRKVRLALANVLTSKGINRGSGMLADSVEKGLLETRMFAHETLSHYLASWGQLCVASSEVDPDELIAPTTKPCGQFCVVFDPLDGYCNVDATMSTIFGVYRRLDGGSDRDEHREEDLLQPPRRLLAAGYCLYGGNTTIVLALAGGPAAAFTLDKGIGEFVLAQEALLIPERAPPGGGICAVDVAHAELWHDDTLTRCAAAAAAAAAAAPRARRGHRAVSHSHAGAPVGAGGDRGCAADAPFARAIEAAIAETRKRAPRSVRR
jgi:fructose-1,6-bisphosphatase